MSPIPDIKPDTDVDVQDSCNCVSTCCVPRGTFSRRKKKVVENKTDEAVQRVFKEDSIEILPRPTRKPHFNESKK